MKARPERSGRLSGQKIYQFINHLNFLIMGLIKKPNELVVKTNLSALIYGQPGMGKTTLALSAPHPLLLDFDGGIHRVNAAHRVDTVQISKWEEVDEVMQDPDIAGYQTIVIDTAGKMLSFMDKYIMQNNPKMRKADGTLSLQGYGLRKNMFINFVNQLSLMGKSVIFVAHEREEKVGDEKQIRPEIGGSSAGDLIKELDLVGYMEAIGKKRTIPSILARSSTGRTPATFRSTWRFQPLSMTREN